MLMPETTTAGFSASRCPKAMLTQSPGVPPIDQVGTGYSERLITDTSPVRLILRPTQLC